MLDIITKCFCRKAVHLSLLVTILFFAAANESAAQEKPLNVLFISIDDMRPATGAYGDKYAITPNIDKISAKGVTFNKAYCQQAVCNPSRASIMTGRRPDETGVVNLEDHFRSKIPNAITIPQLFKNNGYVSVSFGKIFHPTQKTDDPVSWSNTVPKYKGGVYALDSNQGKGKQNSYEWADVDDEAYEDGRIAKDAVNYLEEAGQSGNPFFLAVGFKKPHAPFNAPKKYWDMYNGIRFDISNPNRPEGSPELAFHQNQELRGYRDIGKDAPITTEKEQLLWQGYYACMSYVDAQVGKLLASLEKNGLRENTIIILWGDHGYHLGEQDTWCKSTNFELDARVPLIISAPGMLNNTASNALVELVDVYPTLADLCMLPQPDSLAGLSLRPLLTNKNAAWNYAAYNQFTRPYGALTKGEPTHMGYSIRTKDWRCTYWYNLASGKVVERELYQLRNAATEQKNLAGEKQFKKIESELAKQIDDYRKGKYRKSTGLK